MIIFVNGIGQLALAPVVDLGNGAAIVGHNLFYLLGSFGRGVASKNFVERIDEHLAGAGAVGGAHDSLLFHSFDKPGGAAVTNAQAALQQAGAGFAAFDHAAHGVAEHVVVAVHAAHV